MKGKLFWKKIMVISLFKAVIFDAWTLEKKHSICWTWISGIGCWDNTPSLRHKAATHSVIFHLQDLRNYNTTVQHTWLMACLMHCICTVYGKMFSVWNKESSLAVNCVVETFYKCLLMLMMSTIWNSFMTLVTVLNF